MLQNKKIAWLITIVMITAGIFLGSYTSYLQMRRPVVRAFRDEVESLLNEKIQLVYNMLELYRLNAPYDMDTVEWVTNDIERLQSEMAVMSAYNIFSTVLGQTAEGLYQQVENMQLAGLVQFDERDTVRMRSLLTNVQEMQMILQQTDFNRYAAEYNAAVSGGVPILTRHFPIRSVWRMYPLFN